MEKRKHGRCIVHTNLADGCGFSDDEKVEVAEVVDDVGSRKEG
jgi:hypothetical protein